MDRYVARFWSKVDKSGDCWLWKAGENGGGYGAFYAGPVAGMVSAHRFAYELALGPVPVGKQLDHLCRVPKCVNPAHLDPVSLEENIRRGLQGVLRTHCKEGHELMPVPVGRRGDARRECPICMRTRATAHYLAKRQTRGPAANCGCGCGELTQPGNTFVLGHNRVGRPRPIGSGRRARAQSPAP